MKRGFTLIELMIVVVIIGILAAIAIPNFMSMRTRAKEASTQSNMHTLQLAGEDFSTQAEGAYPMTLLSEVKDVLGDMGITTSPNSNHLADADPADGQSVKPAGTIDVLLPGNNTYRNPFTPADHSVQSEAAQGIPATHTFVLSGEVFWIPDTTATTTNSSGGYTIKGDGANSLVLTLTLTSGQ
jgi:prepilin-type N-terminal cleavage/methylation domain-containing protein